MNPTCRPPKQNSFVQCLRVCVCLLIRFTVDLNPKHKAKRGNPERWLNAKLFKQNNASANITNEMLSPLFVPSRPGVVQPALDLFAACMIRNALRWAKRAHVKSGFRSLGINYAAKVEGGASSVCMSGRSEMGKGRLRSFFTIVWF